MAVYQGPVVPGKFELPIDNLNPYAWNQSEQDRGDYMARVLAAQQQYDYTLQDAIDGSTFHY